MRNKCVHEFDLTAAAVLCVGSRKFQTSIFVIGHLHARTAAPPGGSNHVQDVTGDISVSVQRSTCLHDFVVGSAIGRDEFT